MTFSWSIFLFFFFQAEDGIRDVAVTGVQTCALPIYIRLARSIRGVGSETCKIGADESVSRAALLRVELAVAPCYRILSGKLVIEADEIGRASCRERV